MYTLIPNDTRIWLVLWVELRLWIAEDLIIMQSSHRQCNLETKCIKDKGGDSKLMMPKNNNEVASKFPRESYYTNDYDPLGWVKWARTILGLTTP